MLSDLLLADIDKYYSELHKKIFNAIKLQNVDKFEGIDSLLGKIEEELKNLHDIYLQIFNYEMSITCHLNESRINNIMKETSFTDKFYKKITNLCTNFKTDYIEYIQQRIQEQTNNSMAISSLKIAKSSRTASWFFGVVSTITAFASFYVSYLAYKK